MKLSIDQTELLNEVAEACENEPNAIVIAIYNEFEGIEYISDFVYRDLMTEEEYIASEAPFFSNDELIQAKEEYRQLALDHKANLDSLMGKIKTMSIQDLFEFLKEQNSAI